MQCFDCDREVRVDWREDVPFCPHCGEMLPE